MAFESVFILSEDLSQELLASLAGELQIASCAEPRADGLRLFLDEHQRLSLMLYREGKKAGAVNCDLLTGALEFRRRKGVHGSDMLNRALGFKKVPFSVIDLTAGLGADAFLMWNLGCEVEAVERSPLILALLRDAYHRGLQDFSLKPGLEARFKLHGAEALSFLKSKTQSVDAIYLDPMFPPKEKSAKPPKEIQVLQELAAPATPEEILELWNLSRAKARRVILKRPVRDALELPFKPTFSVEGRSVRLDVWVTP